LYFAQVLKIFMLRCVFLDKRAGLSMLVSVCTLRLVVYQTILVLLQRTEVRYASAVTQSCGFRNFTRRSAGRKSVWA